MKEEWKENCPEEIKKPEDIVEDDETVCTQISTYRFKEYGRQRSWKRVNKVQDKIEAEGGWIELDPIEAMETPFR